MRTFDDIERDLGLRRFLASPLGTLYLAPESANGPRLMVRRFEDGSPGATARSYAGLVGAARDWVRDRPHLARLVRVEQPVEVGSDFVARPFHVYLVRTKSYLEENPPDVPEELEEMRRIFRDEVGRSPDPRDAIVERVLARSILEPSGKTYPGEPEDGTTGTQFVIVDPKLTRQDVGEWIAVTRGG
jgi:hypothetical protein